jgi:hypothetical protein
MNRFTGEDTQKGEGMKKRGNVNEKKAGLIQI